MNDHILNDLFTVLLARKVADPEKSYVASLYEKGTPKIARKVGEEAVEVVIEAMKHDKDKIKEESADLLFHLMVLWAKEDISPNDVLHILAGRMGVSGHDEKANRPF